MAEEHFTTSPGEQECPMNGEKLKPQDFSSEIDSQLDQLISLAELLRKLEDAGPGEMRNGCFYGIADIIEGGADRIKSMVESFCDYMYQKGRMKALEGVFLADRPGTTLLRVTIADLAKETGELKEMAARLIQLGQGTEIDPQAVMMFGKGIEAWRICFEDFLQKRKV